MLETTTTRHNPLIDPGLHVWGWEIPIYLFIGGIVAGMMVFAGIAMLRMVRGEDTRSFFSVQTPLLAFMLLNLGMGALFLDLAHKLYVWAVYLTFEPLSPMSWGSWILIIVYGVLLVSALIRLPDAWPWLTRRLPELQRASDALLARPKLIKALAWTNIVLGVLLGIYTGILLNTMVARPLWNTSILAPLFLVSGLSAAAAMVHLATRIFPSRPAPKSPIGGALAAMVQHLGPQPPAKHTANSMIRADIGFLTVELLLIGLLVVALLSSTAAQATAASLLLGGPYTAVFWFGVVVLGIVVPLLLQSLELGHRIPHTVLPAVLVLAGGLALRWVMVNAGQASQFAQAALK